MILKNIYILNVSIFAEGFSIVIFAKVGWKLHEVFMLIQLWATHIFYNF